MKHGLKISHIQLIQLVFAEYPDIEKVILYGSRAKGNYRKGSDIDLSLVGQAIDFNLLIKIENQLDDLLLPYHIDLSILHTIENPDLIEHIERVGIIFYEKHTREFING